MALARDYTKEIPTPKGSQRALPLHEGGGWLLLLDIEAITIEHEWPTACGFGIAIRVPNELMQPLYHFPERLGMEQGEEEREYRTKRRRYETGSRLSVI